MLSSCTRLVGLDFGLGKVSATVAATEDSELVGILIGAAYQ